MAIQTTDLNLSQRRRPWTNPGTLASSGTAIPQHAVILDGDASIPAMAASDNALLAVYSYLPKSFCYQLVNASLRIVAGSSAGLTSYWPTIASLDIQDFAPGLHTYSPDYYACNSWGITRTYFSNALAYAYIYTPERLPLYPVTPFSGTADYSNFSFSLMGALNSTAVTVHCHMYLLAYDLEQLAHWPANTPGIST